MTARYDFCKPTTTTGTSSSKNTQHTSCPTKTQRLSVCILFYSFFSIQAHDDGCLYPVCGSMCDWSGWAAAAAAKTQLRQRQTVRWSMRVLSPPVVSLVPGKLWEQSGKLDDAMMLDIAQHPVFSLSLFCHSSVRRTATRERRLHKSFLITKWMLFISPFEVYNVVLATLF